MNAQYVTPPENAIIGFRHDFVADKSWEIRLKDLKAEQVWPFGLGLIPSEALPPDVAAVFVDPDSGRMIYDNPKKP